MDEVRMIKMTTASYNALAQKDPDALYFVNATGTFGPDSLETGGNIWLGDKLLTEHPGTLNTNNTAAQATNASEPLSGTVKLHRIAKTGSYAHLRDLPFVSLKVNNDPNGPVEAGWRPVCTINAQGTYLLFVEGGWQSGKPTNAGVAVHVNYIHAGMRQLWGDFDNNVFSLTKLRLVRTSTSPHRWRLDCYHVAISGIVRWRRFTLIGNGQGLSDPATSFDPLPAEQQELPSGTVFTEMEFKHDADLAPKTYTAGNNVSIDGDNAISAYNNILRTGKSGASGEFPKTEVSNSKYIHQTQIAEPGVYRAFLSLTIENPHDAATDVVVGLFGGCCATGDLLSQADVQRTKVTLFGKMSAHVELSCTVPVASVPTGHALYHGYGIKASTGDVNVLGGESGGQMSRIGIVRIGDYCAVSGYGVSTGAQAWL